LEIGVLEDVIVCSKWPKALVMNVIYWTEMAYFGIIMRFVIESVL
jgi:hypothetical protein